MYELFPYFTNDGSVGLYNKSDDDVYHSTHGALIEAFEKYIAPANFDVYFKNNNKIKILDICYGVGYNSKTFLNYFNTIFEKKLKGINTTIEAIDTNNKFNEIYIKAIDHDKKLFYLSPFLKTGKKIYFNNKLDFKNEKISKLLNKKTEIKYKIDKHINIIFLKKIIKSCPEIFEDEEFNKIIKNKKFRPYFDKNILDLYEFYKIYGCNKTYLGNLKGFLHNIYYRYLSRSYKKASKSLRLNDIHLDVCAQDARKALQGDNFTYDFIFLDAFAPVKTPSLWTIDFFKLLHSHLDDNGMILTYSNSAAVRNAFIQSGFWVGKIFNNEADKFTGTIATKKLELIKHGLTEYDLGLIKTKAGVLYRDEKLNLTNEAINAAHAKEVDTCGLQSSSKFIKTFRGDK